MSFFVDVVSEDSFYENLTLGVTKLLESNPCVKNVQLERRGACDRSTLSTWEQKHCCLLTEDLRNFYTSTDGFLLTWSLDIAGEDFPIGRMEIKDLSSLKRHVGTATAAGTSSKEQQADLSSTTSGPSTSSSSSSISEATRRTSQCSLVEPTFGGSRCKLFELSECGDDCKVFLVYQLQPDRDEPSVWLYTSNGDRWYQLADSFVKYFRMMLVHLGLPLWQKCAAGLQLPTWVEQVYLLVGPHLLTSMAPTAAGAAVKQTVSAETGLWSDGPTNLIDPAIFRGKAHTIQHAGARPKTIATNNSTSATAPAAATLAPASTIGNARKKISH